MNKIKKLFIALLTVFTVALSAFAIGCKKDEKFTVSFETNGGTAIASAQFDKGAEYELPTAEKTGYEFEGWYLNADFTGEKTTKITVSENVTVYAKWSKLYTITLDANGGSIDTLSVYTKAGEFVTSVVSGLTPTKTDSQFGVWQVEGKDLSSSYVMPEKDITLTAKYKTKYSVTLWKEDLNGDFVKDEQIVVDYAYAGTTPSKDFGGTGFKLDESAEGSKPLAKISENASENAFVLYYKRESFTVRFNPNYPDGQDGEVKQEVVKFGQSIQVPYDYSASGYYLAGWAKSSMATEVDYESDYISSVLYNGSVEDKGQNSTISPTANITLYGVWVKGNEDMFGGDDYIFISATEENTIYLSRAGKFFKGSINGDEFQFSGSDGKVFLEGKILGNDLFAYKNNSNTQIYTKYINGTGKDTNVTIQMGYYNDLTYTAKVGTKTETSTGTYSFEGKNCIVTFTDGELAGETKYLRLSSVTIDGTKNNIFIERNDDEIALGTLYRGAYSNGNMTEYSAGYYSISLDGFGTATFYSNPLQFGNYSYVFDSEDKILTLYNSSNSVVGSFLVYKSTTKEQYDYVYYDADYDKEFESADKTAKLTLDGSFNAVYEKGDEKIEGIYLSSSSLFTGGKIISLIQNGKIVKSLLITSKTETAFVDGSETNVTSYSFEERAEGYAEYYYLGVGKIYYAPLVVVNDTDVGHMSVYGYTTSGTYEKLSDGNFTETNGVYNYVAETFYAKDITKIEKGENGNYYYYHFEDGEEVVWMGAVEDIAHIETLEFGVGSSVVGEKVYEGTYWYSVKIKDETVAQSRVTEFTSGNSTLTRIGGMMRYSAEGKTILGSYDTSDGVTTITAYDESTGSTETVYVKLDEENKAFVTLESAPYTMYARLKGVIDKNETIKSNGDGTATYTVDGTSYEGVIEKKGKTIGDNDIMQFVSNDKTITIEFLHLTNSDGSVQYFAKKDDTFKTEYEVDGVGTIELDGFGFSGKYTDKNGVVYSGNTSNPATNVLVISGDSGALYFDFSGDTFTVRGSEYGTYYYYDNNIFKSLSFEFDGYGKLKVYADQNPTNQKDDYVKVLQGEGVYEYDEETSAYTLTYTIGSTSYEVNGLAFSASSNGKSFRVLSKLHSENVRFYINDKDWSIIELDAAGNAVKYGAKGNKESGTYTIITDSLLYFVNSSATDACLYSYDKEAGSATQLPRINVSYYTKNLESFSFTEYGFAIYNGSTRYYYDVTDDGEYIVYRQPDEGETAQEVNDYGFIKENLGTLEVYDDDAGEIYYKSFEFKDKVYYYNDGNSLKFTRSDKNGESEEKYKIPYSDFYIKLKDLTFQPSGSDEFSVSCQATVAMPKYENGYVKDDNGEYVYEDRTLSGTINHIRLDNGEYETYFSLIYSYVGYYRVDLDIDFLGAYDEGSTEVKRNNAGVYSVTGLKRVVEAPAYQYLEKYYQTYLITGSDSGITNDIGEVEFVYVYDENGAEIESERHFRGEFGKESGIVDINGNTFTVENGTFEEQSNGLFIVTFNVPDYDKKDGEVKDGYTYRLYTWIARHDAFVSSFGYRVYAYTRVQSDISATDGYEVEAERLIYTEVLDDGYPAGSLFTVSIKKDGEKVNIDARLTGSSVAYLINRTYENGDDAEDKGKITSTKYYAVTFKEQEKDAESDKVMPYASASVTEIVMKTYYVDGGESYCDVNVDEDEVMLIWYKGDNDDGSYYVPSSTEEQEDGTKIITTSDGSVFTVKISGETATIEKTA